MNDTKLRNLNLALRILIFFAAYNGIQAVKGFIQMKMSAGSDDEYTILVLAASLALNYMAFLLFAVISFVMNFVARKSISKKWFIVRSVVMGICLILIWHSAPAISYITYMGASRYTEINLVYPIDIEFIASYISSNLWTVFSYMAAAAVYIVLSVFSVVSIIKNSKKKNIYQM